MHSISAPLAPGAVIQERYQVEDILGKGGSSIVYLVRDLQVETQDNALFALKELRSVDQGESACFAFEGDVLKRLQHPSLPQIYAVSEATEDRPAFIVLDYIAGRNLEILRKQQPDNRYTLSQVMDLMKPIIEATIYLHQQQPPVIHRDIKPANIIMREEDQHTFLVDFGIAKEFEMDATTLALRHCTPGYGSPEQYGNLGTDLRTDIYALGATFYCLLTGTVPMDALQRTTMFVTKRIDPLKLINEIVPNIPQHIGQVIARAMSIDYEQRFPCVEDLWLALQTPVQAAANAPVVTIRVTDPLVNPVQGNKKTWSKRSIAALLLTILLIAGLALGIWSYLLGRPLSSHTATKPTTGAHIIPLQKQSGSHPTATVQLLYPHIGSTYKGTLSNLQTKTKTNFQLTDIKQSQQSISGRFINEQINDPFTGVVDTSNHILLTIPGTAQHAPLFLEGSARSDGNLVGDYCNQDSSGQCIDNYGLWSLSPAN